MFKASELETGRTYLWREEFLPLLYRYLEIRPRQTIVDVGCGTGAFSRLLARGIRYRGKIIGVDRNNRLLSVARRISKEKGINKIISFKEGRAESIPLKDNFADRVVCQMVLWVVRDRRKAIREMVRVCKRSGLVGAVDLVLENVAYYYPDSDRLTELSKKMHEAVVRGYRLKYGSDRNLGYKLPTMLKDAGLERVRLDAYAYVWLDSDDRIPFDFRLNAHRSFVSNFNTKKERRRRREQRRILISGGMSGEEVDEFYKLDYERSENIVRDPKQLNALTSMNGGMFYIATGIKSD